MLYDPDDPRRIEEALWWRRRRLPANVLLGLRRFDEGEYARSARPLRFVKRVSLTLIGPKLQPDERELGGDSDDDDS